MCSSKFLTPTCSYLLLARRLGIYPLWNVSASQNKMPCHSHGMKCSLTLHTSLLILGEVVPTWLGQLSWSWVVLRILICKGEDLLSHLAQQLSGVIATSFTSLLAMMDWCDATVVTCSILKKKFILLVAAMTTCSRVVFACVKRGKWFFCLSHQSWKLWLGGALDGVRSWDCQGSQS